MVLYIQSETDSCNITFVLTHYNASNKLKMLNAFMQPDEFGLTKYTFLTTNHPSFTVQIPFFSQKGVVIFEETDKNCPLESISIKIPFKLYDEKEIIFIYSNYYTNKARKKACLWRFEAPEGYGLKIVIQTFNVSSQTSLRIKNTTDLLINERSVKVNFPYYNNDKYLEIYLSKGNPFFVADIEFQAYVSIVKSEEEKQKINCTIWEADNIITWTNIDENYTGYAANTQCNYNFIVRKHYVVIVNVVDLYMEEGVDFVSYNTDKDNSIIVSNKGVFVIEPYKNGTEKYVSWKENYDIFRVISNNQTILDIGRQKKIFFEIFLNSMNNNIIQVITFSSSKYKTLIISVDSVLEIKIETKIVLSDNETSVRINPIYPVFIPFEMKKPLISLNVSFKIHCVNPSAITLYNNESLAATLDNCFTESSPYTCIIKENSFVLYQEEATVSAITLSNGSKNCVFQKNIILPTNSQIIIVSAISSKNGKCLLTILLDSYYFISHLWTTSKTENVKVFVGIDQTKLLFEFNSNTVNKWKNILLMSPVFDDTNPYICKLKRNEFVAVQRFFPHNFSPYIAVQLSGK
uniref:Uncharacterized protein n=1 Tax=Panagrolaimus sp. PS1159 TaxID=55785 RepID=A0AC35G7S5_9BILA